MLHSPSTLRATRSVVTALATEMSDTGERFVREVSGSCPEIGRSVMHCTAIRLETHFEHARAYQCHGRQKKVRAVTSRADRQRARESYAILVLDLLYVPTG